MHGRLSAKSIGAIIPYLQRPWYARQLALYGICQKPGNAGQALRKAAGRCNLYDTFQRLSQAAIWQHPLRCALCLQTHGSSLMSKITAAETASRSSAAARRFMQSHIVLTQLMKCRKGSSCWQKEPLYRVDLFLYWEDLHHCWEV